MEFWGEIVSDGRILVVDDDPLLRTSIAMLLEDEGYTVELASHGGEVLERVAANRPDVILLDVMMPSMSGTEVLRQLQNGPGTADIPVLVMTAVSGLSAGQIARGVAELVEKPFDVADLLNKIALAIYRRSEGSTSS
jgi:CheY-like chemotaxis protein